MLEKEQKPYKLPYHVMRKMTNDFVVNNTNKYNDARAIKRNESVEKIPKLLSQVKGTSRVYKFIYI